MNRMTDEEYQRIAIFLKQRYGIDMTRKKEIISGRLEDYIKENGWNTYSEYIEDVEKDKSGNLEKKLVNLLSTNHTFFMREPEHFTYLNQIVLPWVRKKEVLDKKLRIWCGASSTGEEPYTIAMALVEYFGLDLEMWDTKVLATDISTDVLQYAADGIYSTEQVEILPEEWRYRFFEKQIIKDTYQVAEKVKKLVQYLKFNLIDEFSFQEKFHVVFLRNVMIYFDENTKKDLIQKVYDVMEPGGYLFIGQTESIDKEYCPFEKVRTSVYRKREDKLGK